MSSCSTSLAPARSFGSVCSPQLTSSLTQMSSMLDTAAEQMMVHKDFQAAFDTCDRGLDSLANMEQEDNRWKSKCTLHHVSVECSAAWIVIVLFFVISASVTESLV